MLCRADSVRGLGRRGPPRIHVPEDGVGTGRAVKVNASVLNSSQNIEAPGHKDLETEQLEFSKGSQGQAQLDLAKTA